MKINIAASVAGIMCAIVVLAAVAVPTINGLCYDTITNSGSVGLPMKQSEAGDGFPFSSMTAEVDGAGQLTATLDGVAMDGVDASSDQFVFRSSSLIVAVLGGSLTCIVTPAEGSKIIKCSGVTVEHGGDPVALTVSIDGGDAIALDEPTGKIYAPAADGKLKSFVDAAGMQKITPGMPTLGQFANVTAGSDGAGVFDSVGYDLVQVGDGLNAVFGRGSAAEASMLMDEPASESVDLMSDVDGTDTGTDSGSIMTLADNPIVVGSLKYVINSDGTATVSGVAEGETLTGALVIPDTIESDGTHNVTSIGGSAFRDCTSLTSVELPAGLTSIGSNAFRDCTSLISVKIPDGVTMMSTYVFQNCTSLASIELPAGLTSIGSNAFDSCTSLASIELPAGLTSIEQYAFDRCTSLTYVKIPDGVAMGVNVFLDCSRLASVELPAGLTSIGSGTFSGCTSLASVELPAGLTSIGNNAFRNCTSLASVELPAGLTSIGENAFIRCSSLTSVELPAGLTSIGSNAFDSCSSLTSVELPAGLTSIGSGTFRNCAMLKSVAFATVLDPDVVFRDTTISQVLNLSGSDVSATGVFANAEIRTDIPATVALDVVTFSERAEGSEYDIIAVIPIILCAGLVIMCLGALVFRSRD